MGGGTTLGKGADALAVGAVRVNIGAPTSGSGDAAFDAPASAHPASNTQSKDALMPPR